MFRFFVAVSLLISIGCSEQRSALRIATSPWPGYEYLYLAEELGYFEEENIQVELVEFLSLADSSRAFERGQVDVWCTTVTELLLSHYHSPRHAVAIWVTNVSNGSDILLARKPLSKPADLRNKRVAIEPATVDIVLLGMALKQAGLSFKDVKLVHMSHSRMQEALVNGTVDAVTIYPPESVAIESRTNIKRIFDSSYMPETIIDLIVAEKNVLSSRQQDLLALLRAFERARRYAKLNPDKALATMSKRIGLSQNEYKQILAGIHMIGEDKQIDYLKDKGKLQRALYRVKNILQETGVEFNKLNFRKLYSDSLILRQKQEMKERSW